MRICGDGLHRLGDLGEFDTLQGFEKLVSA